jgi:hypothetical protein
MDNRAERFIEKIKKSLDDNRGFAYWDDGGSHDQPRNDKYKNHRRNKRRLLNHGRDLRIATAQRRVIEQQQQQAQYTTN